MKAKKSAKKKIKPCILFWVGVVAAIILALLKTLNVGWADGEMIFILLFVLGILLGIIKFKEKETHNAELSTIVLIILMGFLGVVMEYLGVIGTYLFNLLIYFLSVVAPAIILLSTKKIFAFFMGRK